MSTPRLACVRDDGGVCPVCLGVAYAAFAWELHTRDLDAPAHFAVAMMMGCSDCDEGSYTTFERTGISFAWR